MLSNIWSRKKISKKTTNTQRNRIWKPGFNRKHISVKGIRGGNYEKENIGKWNEGYNTRAEGVVLEGSMHETLPSSIFKIIVSETQFTKKRN